MFMLIKKKKKKMLKDLNPSIEGQPVLLLPV